MCDKPKYLGQPAEQHFRYAAAPARNDDGQAAFEPPRQINDKLKFLGQSAEAHYRYAASPAEDAAEATRESEPPRQTRGKLKLIGRLPEELVRRAVRRRRIRENPAGRRSDPAAGPERMLGNVIRLTTIAEVAHMLRKLWSSRPKT